MHQLQVEHDCEERDVESVHFVGKIRERGTDRERENEIERQREGGRERKLRKEYRKKEGKVDMQYVKKLK